MRFKFLYRRARSARFLDRLDFGTSGYEARASAPTEELDVRFRFGSSSCCKLSLVALLVASALSAQSTLQVPASFPTIQSAIAASVSGDTIIVAQGTYFETIDYLGKSLAVISESGPAMTIIDGQQLGTVVRMSTGATGESVLDGFTITNGRGADGNDVTTSGNAGGGGTGGIDVQGPGIVTIRNCRVVSNVGGRGGETPLGNSGDGGAGGMSIRTPAYVIGCRIEGNTAGRGGDAVALTGPVPLIVIGARPGSGGVGGIDGVFGPWYFERIEVVGNRGGDAGVLLSSLNLAGTFGGGTGGVRLRPGVANFSVTFPSVISESMVDHNTGGNVVYPGTLPGHGGLHIAATHLRSTAVTRNTGGDIVVPTPIPMGIRGGVGGVHFTSIPSGPLGGLRSIIHGTIADNDGGSLVGTTLMTGPGGLFVASQCDLKHSIIWGNDNGNGNQSSIVLLSGASCTASESNIEGGFAGTGNFASNPQFSSPVTGDYDLAANSPSRDHSPALPLSQSTTRDARGRPRISLGLADLGAFERHPSPTTIGSDDDLVLETRLDVSGNPYELSRPANGGQSIDVTIVSPRSEFSAAAPFLLAQIYPVGFPPIAPAAWPEIHVDQGFIVVYDGANFGQTVGAGVPLSFPIPFGLSGFVARLQAFAFGPTAKNRIFAATDAHDLILN